MEQATLELKTVDLPAFDELYSFLKEHYKHSRFEGMNSDWCPEYSKLVTESSMNQLERLERGYISCHEAHIGNMIIFNCDLQILNADRPPEERPEYRKNKGRMFQR